MALPSPPAQLRPTAQSHPAARPSLLLRIFNWLGRWHDRRREIRALAQLDDAALKDIGLTAIDVDREIERLCWRRWR